MGMAADRLRMNWRDISGTVNDMAGPAAGNAGTCMSGNTAGMIREKAVADTRPGMERRMPHATAMPTVIRAPTPATAALTAILGINGSRLVRQA